MSLRTRYKGALLAPEELLLMTLVYQELKDVEEGPKCRRTEVLAFLWFIVPHIAELANLPRVLE